jgi:hypothetical protein
MSTPDLCYICYEPATSKLPFMDPNPCACKGSMKIHNHCLLPLVANDKCTVCNSPYVFPDGQLTWHYPNGQIAKQGGVSDNEYQGHWKYYYPDGRLKAEEVYKDGDRCGRCTYYYPSGKIQSEEIYDKGKKTGRWKFYYPNGNLHCKESYRNYKRHGIFKFYHECGLPHCEIMFENDEQTFRRMHFEKIAPTPAPAV